METNTLKSIKQLSTISATGVQYSIITDVWDNEICKAFSQTVQSLSTEFEVELDHNKMLEIAKNTDTSYDEDWLKTKNSDYVDLEIKTLLSELANKTEEGEQHDAVIMVTEFMHDFYDI